MKLCLIWYWPRASEIYPNWRDGLRAALEIIAKKHELIWFLDCKLPQNYDEFDFVLFWGDSNLEPLVNLQRLPNSKTRYGICLSTDPTNINNLRKLDVIFAESEPVLRVCRNVGVRAIKAFGTDISFYKPDLEIKKDIEYFYPATFSPWKRQSEIAYLGRLLLCVGTIQPDGQREYEACRKNNVQIIEGYFPAEQIRNLYRRSKSVVIPAIHGSERTVLEAMACDILPKVIHPENIKTNSYIKEYMLSDSKSSRQFILRNYSHKKYAKELLKGIENV